MLDDMPKPRARAYAADDDEMLRLAVNLELSDATIADDVFRGDRTASSIRSRRKRLGLTPAPLSGDEYRTVQAALYLLAYGRPLDLPWAPWSFAGLRAASGPGMHTGPTPDGMGSRRGR